VAIFDATTWAVVIVLLWDTLGFSTDSSSGSPTLDFSVLRNHKDQAKGLLYLGDLREVIEKKVQPMPHARRAAKLSGAANALFGKVNDAIREARSWPAGRTLRPEALAETSRDDLKEIFCSQ
jgi:hypothetical protein